MTSRMRMMALDELAPEVQSMVTKWMAEGGDPNFSRTFGRLPALLRDFITFYSRLMRKGLLPVRLKESSASAWRGSHLPLLNDDALRPGTGGGGHGGAGGRPRRVRARPLHRT